MKSFWRAVALFAYRRWATPESQKPVGIPGNRDPDNPCPCYAPRPPQISDFRDCQTDGHSLCWECAHRKPTVVKLYGDVVDTAELAGEISITGDPDIIHIKLW